MATICKIQKCRPNPNFVSGQHPPSRQYIDVILWAILDDTGHTIFEADGVNDYHFRQCREWLVANPQPLIACLNCQD